MMARQGWHVTVLEQQARPGGCLQCFTRCGARFETGMHYIGSAAPGQKLYRILDSLGVAGDIQLQSLDTSGYDTITLHGLGTFHYANGREAFVETLSAETGASPDIIARYHDVITALSGAWSPDNLSHDLSAITAGRHLHTMSVNAVLDEMIPDPLLRLVLAGNLPLYAGERDRTPFATAAFITDFYNRSAYRIVGGSDTLSDALIRRIVERDGTVRTSSAVTRIVCDATHAVGVEVNGSEFVPADMVIAAIHPASVMRLTDSRLLRAAQRARICSIPNTVGCFCLYLRFRPGTMPYAATNYFSYADGTPWGAEEYTPDEWPKAYLYMHGCHSPSPRFAETGIVIAYMRWDDVRQWSETTVGHRGAEYEAFKEAQARRLLARLEADHPGLTSCIDSYYTSTPLTYRDYTGTPCGAMYGIVRDVSAGASGRVQHRLRIPNLRLAGQNINSHGILGTLVGSLLATTSA